MDKELDLLSALFNTDGSEFNISVFLLGIFFTALLSLLLALVYIRFGNALSNRRNLAKILVLVSLTTMLIISIVKSSLALSLGLVGALSIVRFRTAIKDPEELAYFFLSIAIGLGMGANQIVPTTIGTFCIFLIIFILNRNKQKEVIQNLILHFEVPKTTEELEQVTTILKRQCKEVSLRRMDEGGAYSEISFTISLNSFSNLLKIREELQAAFPNIRFSFLEII